MNRITTLILGVFLWEGCINAQIGINTECPYALFHIDAANNNNNAQPSTQTAIEDDVVVTSDGRLGIGTISPSSKVEINTQKNVMVYPIQLKDGTQSDGRFLVSDADGFASWKTIFPVTNVYPIRIIPTVTLDRGRSTLLSNSEFTVPHDGFFSFEVRWWASCSVGNTDPAKVVTVFELRKNGVVIDQFQYNTPYKNRAMTLYIPLYAKALENDVLSLWLYPKEAPGNLVTNTNLDWTTSKILIKELQIDKY